MEKNYNYSCTTGTIWTSFDGGTVKAKSLKSAEKKAKIKLAADLDAVNEVLASNPKTANFSIDFDLTQLDVSLSDEQ